MRAGRLERRRGSAGVARHRLPFFLAAVAAVVLAIAPAARAQPVPTLTLAALPSSLALAPGETGNGVLVIANPSAVAVTPTGVQATSASPTTTVHVDPLPATPLAAGASETVPFRVVRASEGYDHDVGLLFTLGYSSVDGAGVAATTAAVTAAASPTLVGVAIDGNAATISEYRPADLAIVVTNLRSSPVTLTELDLTGTQTVDVSVDIGAAHPVAVAGAETRNVLGTTRIQLGPRAIETFGVHLSTGNEVQPGNRTLLVRAVAVNAPAAGGTAATGPADEFEAVATAPFTVEVYGESDILKGIGVPGFLLLPGVVLVVVIGFLISKLSPWRAMITVSGTPSGVVGAATAVAVFGLGASLVMAKVYPLLTEGLVPGTRRDYLQAYGFDDFYYVLGYAFAIGVLVWALSWPAHWVARGMLWLPVDGDSPKQLLNRLGFVLAQRTNEARPLTSVPANAADQRAVAVQLRARGPKLYVSPVIQLTVMGEDDARRQRWTDLVARNRLTTMAREVRKSGKSGEVQVSFAAGMLAAPKTANESDATPTGQQRRAVELA